MSEIFERVKRLIAAGFVRISEHGYDELMADGILSRDVMNGINDGIVVEDYPNYPKGPCASMGGWIQEEASMRKQQRTKLVHEGRYLAEVTVELLVTDDEWSPYLSIEDAYKLDDVREALKKGDAATAGRYGRVYTLTPITV